MNLHIFFAKRFACRPKSSETENSILLSLQFIEQTVSGLENTPTINDLLYFGQCVFKLFHQVARGINCIFVIFREDTETTDTRFENNVLARFRQIQILSLIGAEVSCTNYYHNNLIGYDAKIHIIIE